MSVGLSREQLNRKRNPRENNFDSNILGIFVERAEMVTLGVLG